MHRDSVSVKLVAGAICAKTEFVLPLVYADNPPDSLTGPLFAGLTVTDCTGLAVDYTSATRQIGPVACTSIKPAKTPYSAVIIQYRIDFDAIFNDSVTGPLSLVFMNNQTGFIMGAHLFAVPCEPSLVDLWRAPRSISLGIETGPAVTVTGLPASTVSLRNAYELLFVQLALNVQLLAQASGGGQSAAFYGLNGFEYSSQELLSVVSAQFGAILDTLVPIWGELSQNPYPVIFHNITAGGTEGMYSFICKPPHIDRDTTIAMVLAHEAIHHVLGIRCGERDDPWWKEGTTFYLGYAVSSRLGMVAKQKVYDAFGDTLEFKAEELLYAPSDARMRERLFADKLYNVTYFKGGQIAMLMDVAVRIANSNRLRLDEVTAELCRRYDGDAFGRQDFINHFSSYANTDISGILARFADAPGNIPGSILRDAFNKLDSLGAFGPGSFRPALVKKSTRKMLLKKPGFLYKLLP
jgi:hypothetical protein